MTGDEIAALAVEAWVARVRRNSPGVRLKRELAAIDRDYRRKLAAGRRAIASHQAAKQRVINRQWQELESESQCRLWDFLMKSVSR